MESSDNPFQEDDSGVDWQQIFQENPFDIKDIDSIISLDYFENLQLPSPRQITTTTSNSNSRSESSGESESDSPLWAEPSTSASYSPPSRAGSSGGAGSPAQQLQPEPYVELYVPPNATSQYRYQRDLDKEKRHSGVIPGPRGTSGRATHPTIKLHYHSRHATRRPLVVAFCITDEEPYRAHPNKLFGGKDTIEIVGGMGVGYMDHNNEFSLYKVGIVRVRKDEIAQSLKERAQAIIKNLPHDVFLLQNVIDLDFEYKTALLRLVFHVFLPVGEDGWSPLQPVISDVVRLVKSNPATTSQLEIDEIYPVVGFTEGGTMIIIYIKKGKVNQNLRVVFIEEDERGWEEDAHVKKIKNRTIVVLAPKYEGRPTSPGGRARVNVYVCDLAGERVSNVVRYIYYQARRTPPATDVRYSVLPADAELDESPGSSSRAESSNSSSEEANEAPAPPDSTVQESQYIPDANAIEVMRMFGHLKL